MLITEFSDVSLKRNQLLLTGLSLKVMAGDCLYITGASASGKSTLLNALKSKTFIVSGSVKSINIEKIVLIEDKNLIRDRSGRSDFYYQQRFDAAFADDSFTVAEELGSSKLIPELLKEFGILHLLDQHLIKLSNGENKKLQIIKALLKKPKLILLDNPFTGLDVASVQNLLQFLNHLRKKQIALVIACRPSLLPENPGPVLELTSGSAVLHQNFATVKKQIHEIRLNHNNTNSDKPVVELKNINISYGERQILKNFSWEIHPGEKWLLRGPNGAGKSTVISLINADNTQVYANQVYVFGRKRGSGESIWEIKSKIGFFSPELHLCFDLSMSVEAALASGFFDTLHASNRIDRAKSARIDLILGILGLSEYRKSYLYELTFSQQRLILIGRAIIKEPELLILDEPCQNLDIQQVNLVKSIVNKLPERTTLIYISHLEDEVPEVINRLLEIRDGEIVKKI